MRKTAVLAVTITALSAAMYAVVSTAQEGGRPIGRSADSTLRIPAGTYTAIVIGMPPGSYGSTARIRADGQHFPVTLSPGATTVLPFPDGWSVDDAQASIVLDGAAGGWGASGPSSNTTGAFAWGITQSGPIAFRTRSGS
jgi:hypothetical protein